MLNHIRLLLMTTFSLLAGTPGHAQRERLLDHNPIGWYVYNGDHKLTKTWTLHAEYQWRRIDLVRTWQQSLARLGLQYELSDRAKVGGGYTYFVTFPYGDYPQADQGIPYPEHRIYQDISLGETYGRLALSQRFRLEQRWLAELAEQDTPEYRAGQIAGWTFQNRVRYQIAGEIALTGTTIGDGEFYLNFFDELFIGFGRNVGENIYNQNRLSAGLGYQFADGLQVELNALSQVVQHAQPDAITGRPVFEINNGFRLNVNHALNLIPKSRR
ncbi:MAG: DUF2490 domain-containing protein [Bacteroidetes bacterium]|nr:DUF2490 domain-containing protein [Fibrella sp.]